jgi:mannose-6-phosphate isomerase-like protein (cupin superfamily)
MSKGYQIIKAHEAKDSYEGTDVPGEYRRLTPHLGSEQVAVTLIHIPPHSDFEQGTGHYHSHIEEIYIITRGELTMRFGEDLVKVPAGSAVRVAPETHRSHRNEGDEPVDMWAISIQSAEDEATLIREFWEASPKAKQKR